MREKEISLGYGWGLVWNKRLIVVVDGRVNVLMPRQGGGWIVLGQLHPGYVLHKHQPPQPISSLLVARAPVQIHVSYKREGWSAHVNNTLVRACARAHAHNSTRRQVEVEGN